MVEKRENPLSKNAQRLIRRAITEGMGPEHVRTTVRIRTFEAGGQQVTLNDLRPLASQVRDVLRQKRILQFGSMRS